jgi:TrpR-related protein YerC/YecD
MKAKSDEITAKITSEKAENQLFQAVTAIESIDEAKQFLRDLCTPAELQAMADRWLVVALLKKGESYRTISQTTGVSVTTIGRVARHLEYGNNGYNLIYERLSRGKNVTENNKITNSRTKKGKAK